LAVGVPVGGVVAGVSDVGSGVVLDAWSRPVLSPLVVDEGLLPPPPPHAVKKTQRSVEVVVILDRDIFCL
jgi:hypothetical protein